MADSVSAALRVAAAQAAGLEPNPADFQMGAYGTTQNLAQTVGGPSYDDYMRWINRNNLPAYPSSGAHYSPPGMREGYEERNISPVLYQRSPYASAAYRTFVDPWGQMMVQPLVGFPSRYPHVLSGVPTNFTNDIGYAMSLLGPLPQWQPPAQQPAPAQQAPPTRRAQSTVQMQSSAPTYQRTAQPPSLAAQRPIEMVHYGDARARADAMPPSPENLAWMNSLQTPAPAASSPTGRPVGMYPGGATPSSSAETWFDALLRTLRAPSAPVQNPYGNKY